MGIEGEGQAKERRDMGGEEGRNRGRREGREGRKRGRGREGKLAPRLFLKVGACDTPTRPVLQKCYKPAFSMR